MKIEPNLSMPIERTDRFSSSMKYYSTMRLAYGCSQTQAYNKAFCKTNKVPDTTSTTTTIAYDRQTKAKRIKVNCSLRFSAHVIFQSSLSLTNFAFLQQFRLGVMCQRHSLRCKTLPLNVPN